jgi:hypothetical protein
MKQCAQVGQTKKPKKALPLAGNYTCAKIAVAVGYFNRCILIYQ